MAGILSSINSTYSTIADLNLWFKNQAGEGFSLTDFPDLIPFRWEYFRDNWNFVRTRYEDRIETYDNPDLLKTQITNLTEFIDAQRNSKNNPFRKRSTLFQFFAIFDNTSLTEIGLTIEEQNLINNKLLEIENYKRDDFVEKRRELEIFRDQYTDLKGLSDEAYNDAFNRSSIDQQTNATNFDINQLQEINNTIKSINFILANEFSLNKSFVDPYSQARINANNPDIEIRSYSNGYLVNMPYGQDLRGLARDYLGDEERWIEIAIANGLKPPYIDEIGERLPLIANGAGNKIAIAGINAEGELNSDKTYINQVVYLSSNTYTFADQRVIINIEEIPVSGNLIIELDGPADLDKYRIDSSAHLRIFKPQTINSSLKVLIPEDAPPSDDRKDITPWFLSTSPEDAKAMKIDMAINEDGDLLLGNNSDLGLSYSYDNAIQAIRLKMQVEYGELSKHRDYGFPDFRGIKNKDIEAIQAIIAESISDQIQLDTRFDRIETLNISYSVNTENPDAGVGFNIAMDVKLAGSLQTIPISFKINV